MYQQIYVWGSHDSCWTVWTVERDEMSRNLRIGITEQDIETTEVLSYIRGETLDYPPCFSLILIELILCMARQLQLKKVRSHALTRWIRTSSQSSIGRRQDVPKAELCATHVPCLLLLLSLYNYSEPSYAYRPKPPRSST
jgi:hypothetical protein